MVGTSTKVLGIQDWHLLFVESFPESSKSQHHDLKARRDSSHQIEQSRPWRISSQGAMLACWTARLFSPQIFSDTSYPWILSTVLRTHKRIRDSPSQTQIQGLDLNLNLRLKFPILPHNSPQTDRPKTRLVWAIPTMACFMSDISFFFSFPWNGMFFDFYLEI